MHKELTELQNKFLDALFGPAKGNHAKAMKIAGYSEATNPHHIINSVRKHIIERAELEMAVNAPKAVLSMVGVIDDPSAIGPAMAVALLTTLYGAMLANVIFLPMKLSLEQNSAKEVMYREMVITALRSISRGESPRNIQDQLLANLPPKQQEKIEAAAAAST